MFSRLAPTGLAAGIAALGLAFSAVPASSAYLYIDDFNRSASNSVGNGWTEIERNSSDVAIINLGYPHYGVLQLRDYRDGSPDAAATKLGISTLGLMNLSIRYDWKGYNTESGDYLYAEWKLSTETDWQPLATNDLSKTSWQTTGPVSLGAVANNASIDIRFWTDVTDPYTTCSGSGYKKKCKTYDPGHDETAKVDNIKLYYELLPPEPGPSETPIPGAFALFASGGALFGGMLYRRRRKGDAAV